MDKASCIKNFKLSLKPHQIKAVKYLLRKEIGGLLVSHPTGWGKTITALAFTGCFLQKYPKSKVIIVAPVGVLNNFKNYVKNLELDSSRIEIYSYQKFTILFSENKIECSGNALIIDEVHNLRNLGTFSYILDNDLSSKEERSSKEKGLRAKTVLECSKSATKRLLLTATPFVNELKDFLPIINFIYGGHLINKKGTLKDINSLDKYLKNHVYFIQKKDKDINFPSYTEKYVDIKMPKEYQKSYCSIIKGEFVNQSGFSNPKSFYNAHRRAVNKIGKSSEYFSMKIKKTVSIIGNYKSVIYSNWLEYGIEPISKSLKEAGISFGVYTGSITESKKNKIIENFNNDLFKVLLVSSSGKEGLDLKGVRRLIVMDPVWNYAGMEQIKGRAIRYGSHSHLPPNERKVEIYYLLLTTDDSKCLSGDTIVYRFIEEKKKLQTLVDNKLKSLSI